MVKFFFNLYKLNLFQLWNDKHRKEQVVPALKESLKNLGLEYVDLYLIHFPIAEKVRGLQVFYFGFTLFPVHSKVGRKNLVLRHSVSHLPPNSEGFVFEWRNLTPLFASTPERRNEGNKYLTAQIAFRHSFLISQA